ncbi:MAG: hypothetical protein FWF92_04380 [Oscillospiraceae bacterium]|nr:hypothetical protein [Oscillospiraceae bacterium]
MKKFIGLIMAVITIIFSIVIFKGTVRYLGTFIGLIIGTITSIIIYGINNKKYISSIIIVFLIIVINFIILFIPQVSFILDDVHDYFAIENTLNLQLHESYSINTSVIKEYIHIKENSSLTYFFRFRISDYRIMDTNMDEYKLELPDELLNDIASSGDINHVILSLGRELKEIKYKFLGKFSDGVTSKAKITFCEEYKEDIIYAYFINKNIYFWEAEYYIMENDAKVFLGNDIRYINAKIPK